MAISFVFSDPVAPAASRLAPLGAIKQVLRGERAPQDLAETRAVLLELARRKSGRLPPALLVEQVLAVTEDTDWPCRRAAMDAVLRRLGFSVRDGLSIAKRPAGGAPFGRYVLAGGEDPKDQGGKRTVRPYHTQVESLEPLSASCDCADFVRSSLGLCKHLLVVLEDLCASPRKLEAARRAQDTPAAGFDLRWDPVRPWTGPGDRVAGLRYAASQRERKSAVLHTLHKGFARGLPSPATLARPERRAALLEALGEAAAEGLITADPAALAVIRAERALAERRQQGRAGSKQILAHLASLKRTLYPYQREGIQRFIEEQRLLLADDMGLGKTTQAIAACHALYAAGRVERGLLIVPAALKSQWLREWQATTDRAPLEIVEGNQEERTLLYRRTRRGFLVMNYEQLLRDLDLVRRFAPEIVVLDEAQRLKNWATKSSAYVMSLEPEWRLVLTGTPMENRLEELATLLDWVDDAALAPKWRLVPWHTAWGVDGTGERVGARNLDTLRQRTSACVLRRVRREVLSQLPPRSDVRLPVEMTGQQREEHDALIMPVAQLLQTGRRRPLRQAEFLKLMQLLTQQRIISNGMAVFQFDEVWPTYSKASADEALLRASCSPKLVEFRRLIADLVLEQGRRVVVFSQWRRMLRLSEWAVRDLLEAEGLRSVFFTGGESQDLRTRNVVDFHDDESVRVMFLSDAGGVGLNLQRASNACVNLELPWNPAVLEQRIGRIYRLGQEHPIDVFNLVSEYGIEARIAGLISNKKALFTGLFDGTTDAVRFDTPAGFLADIERLVEPVSVPVFVAESDSPEDAEQDEPEEVTASVPEPSAVVSAPAPPAVVHEPPAVVSSPEPSAVVSQAPVPRAVASAPEPPAAPPVATSATPLPGLLARVSVSRLPNGSLRLEAPPEAADELSQLLHGLAALLAQAAERGSIVREPAEPSRDDPA